MFDAKVAQELAKKFVESLPPGLKSLNKEVETHLRQFLQECFNKMELVTREEFDVQTQVLNKTRAKLEQMEATLNTLEIKLQQDHNK